MKILIKKDIKIVGILTNYLLILLGLMFGFLTALIDGSFIRILLCSSVIFLMVNIALLKMWSYDFSKKTDMFLNSLPLDKELIVASRYASILIYVLCSSLLVFIMSRSYRGVFDNEPIYPINLNEALNIIAITMFIIACYLPRYYRKGLKAHGSSNISLFIMVAIIVIVRYSNRIIRNIDLSQVSFVLIILSIIAYIVSLRTSIKLYKSQEF